MELNTTISLSQSETEHWNFKHFTLSVWNSTQNNFILSISKKYTQQFHSRCETEQWNFEYFTLSVWNSTHNNFTLSVWNSTHNNFTPLIWKPRQQSEHPNFKLNTQQFYSLSLKQCTQSQIWISWFEAEHTTAQWLLQCYWEWQHKKEPRKSIHSAYRTYNNFIQGTGHTTILTSVSS